MHLHRENRFTALHLTQFNDPPISSVVLEAAGLGLEAGDERLPRGNSERTKLVILWLRMLELVCSAEFGHEISGQVVALLGIVACEILGVVDVVLGREVGIR